MSKKKYNKSININGEVVSNEEVTTEEPSTTSEENAEEIQVTVETEEKVEEVIQVTVQTGTEEEKGIASESDDNSNTAVENEETHDYVEEEVTTANIEDGCPTVEEPEVVLAQVQPVEDEIYVKILTDSKKDELIKSRLFNAGIAYAETTDGIIIAGPCATREEAISLKKKIAGCGLRCTIR